MKRAVAVTICACLYAFMVTQGTFQFIVPDGPGPLARAFDALAESLVQNRADVGAGDCTWECLHNKQTGKHYLYWGPWPALIRIPTLALSDARGGWSRLSCFIAAMLALGAWGAGSARALGKQRANVWALYFLCFALGTPLLFLIGSAQIYHEVILWGVAGGLWAVVGTYALLTYGKSWWFIPTVIGTNVAWLARPTFGAAAFALLGWCLIYIRPALRWWIFTLIVSLIGVGIYGWYNILRFDDPLMFMNFKWHYQRPEIFGGISNLQRLPDALWEYFIPHEANFTRRFPWIQEAEVVYPTTPHIFDRYVEWVTPLFISMLWLWLLVIPAIVGMRTEWIVPILILGVQATNIATIWMVTQRYTAEFLPLAVLLGLIGMRRLYAE